MRAILGAALALAVCAGAACEGSAPPDPDPQPNQCQEGISQSALEAVDRKIVGDAVPYAADGTLRARDAELASSQRARREVAWKTVQKLLVDVPLSQSLPGAPGVPAVIPTWQTWYDMSDVRRVFHRLYADIGSEGRKARAHFSDADIDDTFEWNLTAVDGLPGWSQQRYLDYLQAISDAEKVAGLGGISRVQYSPAAARQLINGYPEALGCLSDGAPPPHVDGPTTEVRVIRTAAVAAECSQQSLGSFAAGDDEVLRATLEAGDGAKVTLRSGDVSCTAEPGMPCEVKGPGTFELTAQAGDTALDSFVAVDRLTNNPEWAACLQGPFPVDAAVVKSDWRRAQLEIKVPTYDTSADALSALLASSEVEWPQLGEADPGPSDIYTVHLPNDTIYRLSALHLMTKELDHWIWITLWWSPTPDDDFGADRPAELEANGVWKNYKMCVATSFEEEDPDPAGGFANDHPSLAAALSATYGGVGAPSWCSNPYIELGHANGGTNCIGCHQHAGTELFAEDILDDETDFPAHGRTKLRNNFPTDYSWAINQGDHLGQLFQDEESYYGDYP